MKGSENLDIEIIKYGTITSTNACAKEFLKSCERTAPFCIIADKQTGGYGQAGRRYYCPQGGLYMSLVLSEKSFEYKFAAGFAAVCVAKVISRFVTDGRQVTIKWINDINLDSRKIGGVLIEKVGTAFIIGIGINLVQTEDIPCDLKGLMGFVDTTLPARSFADEIIRELTLKILTDEQVLTEYKEYCGIDGLNIDGSLSVIDVNGKLAKKFSNF